MERTSLCVACDYYGCVPPALAVDPACCSSREADALCPSHRAKMTEGYCVLCGRREPWVSPWPESRIGCCEDCFRGVFGACHADVVAESRDNVSGSTPDSRPSAGSCRSPRAS